MDDCIFREKLLEHIKDLPTWWSDGSGIYSKPMKYPDGMFYCEDVVASIENAPAADVAPITHAKWKYGKCTHCGAEIPTENKHYLIESNKCKYCYSCGAIMDER